MWQAQNDKRLVSHHPPWSCQCPAALALVLVVFVWCLSRETLKFYQFFFFIRPKLIPCIFRSLSNPPFITPVHPHSRLSRLSRPSLSLHLDRPCYLPNIVRQRSGIFYWLKIKVAKSPPRSPPLLLAALKNRGKHQFLPHQWRLHNQLKKTLVWGCKSYLCLIRAFRRCMSGFNVTK